MARRVVIVGGGASGALVAARLLRRGGLDLEIVVVEPREQLGLGAAYSTLDPWHRLNVPAATVSALPEDPDHFRRWLDADPGSYPSRADYGRYLGAVLDEAASGSAASLRHVHGMAERLASDPAGGFVVSLATGGMLHADALVVATGNERPAVPGPLRPLLADARMVAHPWLEGAMDVVRDGEFVGVVGTSHTAIDLASTLIRRHGCRVVMLSRHGDLPFVHEEPWRARLPAPVVTVEEAADVDDPFEVIAERIRAHGEDWRRALDSLRPITQRLWLMLDDGPRQRFIRDWRHAWEIRRSRVPPETMRDLDGWRADGRLEIRAGRIERVQAAGERLQVEGAAVVEVDRILLATGPDEAPAGTPFLARAVEAGLFRPGPLGLGLDADPATLRALDAAGSAARPAYVIGPLLKGVLWETTAIPEIREQAARIAARILVPGG
jgi:uncharacterized NAD(P)/FAD-binding protein YdhS